MIGMYKSPIDLIYEDMSAHMVDVVKKVDEDIWQAIVRCVPNIDKDELLRALQYDRDQYNKGYADGRRDAMDELVRCKDCKYYKENELRCDHPELNWEVECYDHWIDCNPDDFCSSGKRRAGE